ncbi:MAG: lysophospholipid acyltransferase family protein [Planctomycetota bacterium]
MKIQYLTMYKCYRLIFTVYSWTLFVLLWLSSILTAIVLSMDTREKEHVFNTIERYFSRIAFKLLGMKVEIEGVEHIPQGEPVIFISNHQSMMDIKLAIACIPTNISFVAKESIFDVPILGAYMRVSGHIPIKRNEDRKAYASLLAAIKNLTTKNKSLVVFPEGTRSEDGQLGVFKRGISLIILKSGRRVVPMAIDGSNQFMPKRGFLSHPGKRYVRIAFGKPLSFDSSRTDREYTLKMTEELHGNVSRLLHK